MTEILTDDQKQFLRMWIGALRSGEYKQGIAFLSRRVGDQVRHCCLGVAAAEATGEEGYLMLPGGNKLLFEFDGKGGVFSSLDKALGTVSTNCSWPSINDFSTFEHFTGLSDSIQDDLIDANDSNGKSFEEIADALETFLTVYEQEGYQKAEEEMRKILEV